MPELRVVHVMGTVVSFAIRTPMSSQIHRALDEAETWLRHVDAVFSTYRPDSQISRLAAGTLSLIRCAPEVREVLALCADIEAESNGHFTTTPRGRLDPSGLVKGWATETVSDILYAAGATDHCINAGGDVQTRSSLRDAPWRIGIAHPHHPGDLTAIVTGTNMAVATSGTSERGEHIIDPHTGRASTGLVSLTLVGRHLTRVDALATAGFAMGEDARDWIASLPDIEAFAITTTGRAWQTPAFPVSTPA
ncbi:FAD:protein FMN transferase [Actinomadura rupiterrae]|uniref:FAD:protein FMN transferase n=1 Tax=Actinomadura rupiterrae TaxID=559627 RepID=UPI0020A45461|nr:FAD:protein FMN transferase [Actinomadura rupiterrae]MCP2343799.1 thiamine biosynthesis lipoprotein [Actinomadura rupiterrae]